MSVLIYGMKVPKDCPMCPLAHWTKATDEFTGCDIVGGKKYARIKDKEYANSSTRPDWCPLVELPETCDTCKHNQDAYDSGFCDGCSTAHSSWEPMWEGER